MAATYPVTRDARAMEPALPAEIRRSLQQFRSPSALRGFVHFILDASIYGALFFAVATLRMNFALTVLLSMLLGLFITRLFIVGHDAAHGALTGRPRLDAVVARLAFLPSLHPCSLWQVGHNRVHHSFTNLKGIDFIWTPFSPNEFLALPRWRRNAERFYRSVAGMGAYYMIEIWWNYLSIKGMSALGSARLIHRADVALTLAFLLAQVAVVYVLTPSASLLLFTRTLAVAVVIPFLVWNWLMGFIIYSHHTHESVRFYDNRREWRFFEGQVKGTVHVIFPKPFGLFLNEIMEHTAHHIDIKIPFYRLAHAQRFLEEHLRDDLIVQRWSVQSFLSTVRSCQLYDYEQHRWSTFNEAKGKTR